MLGTAHAVAFFPALFEDELKHVKVHSEPPQRTVTSVRYIISPVSRAGCTGLEAPREVIWDSLL